jgi:hypothetical protein
MADASLPESSWLNLEDKAKMDYQMKLDKEKLVYAYKQVDFRKLLWDRGVFGLSVVVFGALSLMPINCYLQNRQREESQALERYKLEEAHKRFLLEKRLEALVTISAAHSEMTQVFFQATDRGKPAPGDHAKAAYRAAIDKFLAEVNRNLPILNVEFDEDMNRYLNIHRSLRDIDPGNWVHYKSYVSNLDNQFNELCRSFFQSGETKGSRMTFKRIAYEERIAMTPQQYLDAQVAYFSKKIPKIFPIRNNPHILYACLGGKRTTEEIDPLSHPVLTAPTRLTTCAFTFIA